MVPLNEQGIQIKKQEALIVSKRPNTLDKGKPSGARAQGNAEPSGRGGAAVAPEVDVRKLTMAVMEEVHKQMSDIAAKQVPTFFTRHVGRKVFGIFFLLVYLG
jgi:hypothetical protein